MYLFSEIHDIVFHGQGGYDWQTVYNMPIWLRKFTYSKIAEHYKAQSEQIKQSTAGKNSNKTTLMDSEGNINRAELQRQNLSKVQYK